MTYNGGLVKGEGTGGGCDGVEHEKWWSKAAWVAAVGITAACCC